MRKTIHTVSLAVPSLVLAFTAVVTVPVFAQRGSADDAPVPASNTSTQTSGTGSDAQTKGEKEAELHSRGAALVAQLRQQHPSSQSEAARQKACEARSHGLETKFTRITTNSQNLEDRIGTFLTKAEAYQSTNNVTVDSWDTLTGNADTAKAAVDSAITDLKAVTPQSLDCASTTVAQNVATFKAAAVTVRDDLQAYKQAVIKVFTALQNAKGATATDTTNTTEGSNQ